VEVLIAVYLGWSVPQISTRNQDPNSDGPTGVPHFSRLVPQGYPNATG